MEGHSEIDNSLDFFFHSYEKVRMHIGIKPIEIFRSLLKLSSERSLNSLVKNGFGF